MPKKQSLFEDVKLKGNDVIGKYTKDICPECGGHLKEHKLFDFGFLLIPEAIVHMKCENCGELVGDICESRTYARNKRWQEKLKKMRAEERKISMF